MLITTTRNGREERIEVADDDVVEMPHGLLGFEEHNRFGLIRDADLEPFILLQSLVDPWVGFLAVDVTLLQPDYELVLSEAEEALLGTHLGDLSVLAIVKVGSGPEDTSVNLFAPIVISRRRRLGLQVVQSHLSYSVAEPLFSGEQSGLLALSGLG